MASSAVHVAASSGYDKAHTENYNAVRSGYTPAIADYIVDLTIQPHDTQPLTILDLGAGSGKWTTLLLDALTRQSLSYKLIAVDPVQSMVDSLHKQLPDVQTVVAPASELPFADQSVYLITAATAFHWFADAASIKEIHRVLKPNAYFVALMYDWSEKHDWTPSMGAYLDTFYADGTPYIKHGVWREALTEAEAAGLFTAPIHKCFPETSVSRFDRTTIVERFTSASKVAALPLEEKQRARLHFQQIVDKESPEKTEFITKDDVNVYSVRAR